MLCAADGTAEKGILHPHSISIEQNCSWKRCRPLVTSLVWGFPMGRSPCQCSAKMVPRCCKPPDFLFWKMCFAAKTLLLLSKPRVEHAYCACCGLMRETLRLIDLPSRGVGAKANTRVLFCEYQPCLELTALCELEKLQKQCSRILVLRSNVLAGPLLPHSHGLIKCHSLVKPQRPLSQPSVALIFSYYGAQS